MAKEQEKGSKKLPFTGKGEIMRTREKGYSNYGISEKEAKVLLDICKNADEEEEKLLLESAQESNSYFASSIFYSLRNNVSFEKLEALKEFYAGKGDFYGYRRQALFIFKIKLIKANLYKPSQAPK